LPSGFPPVMAAAGAAEASMATIANADAAIMRRSDVICDRFLS
jgi:hypothetical protein